MANQIEVVDGIPVELTDEQETLWASGKMGQRKARKQIRQARKDWHDKNMDGLDDDTGQTYDELFGGDDE